MYRWLFIIPILGISFIAACKPARQKAETPATAEIVEPAAIAPTTAESDMVASLIDPAKLATLKSRGTNPRIMKIVAILATAKNHEKNQNHKKNQNHEKNPQTIVNNAIAKIGWGNSEKGRLTAAAILRNLEIAEKLGCTTPEDIAAMRRGRSPTVRRGPSAGDILSVDHIIPRAVVPELDNCIANLELMPLKLNQNKNDSIGPRQRDLAQKLYAAGLLENPGRVR